MNRAYLIVGICLLTILSAVGYCENTHDTEKRETRPSRDSVISHAPYEVFCTRKDGNDSTLEIYLLKQSDGNYLAVVAEISPISLTEPIKIKGIVKSTEGNFDLFVGKDFRLKVAKLSSTIPPIYSGVYQKDEKVDCERP